MKSKEQRLAVLAFYIPEEMNQGGGIIAACPSPDLLRRDQRSAHSSRVVFEMSWIYGQYSGRKKRLSTDQEKSDSFYRIIRERLRQSRRKFRSGRPFAGEEIAIFKAVADDYKREPWAVLHRRN